MITQTIKKLYTLILDLLFPIHCLGCQKQNGWICPNCLSNIKDFSFDNELLKHSIQIFKYQGVKDLSLPLGKLLKQKAKNLNYDYIIPVPLHKRKLGYRGFNQTELLANEIKKELVLTDILLKTKKTKPQMKLPKEKRLKNLKNSFLIKNNSKIKNKTILLIDDVKTTGTTLLECKKVLLESGVKEVLTLTLIE